MQTLKIDATWLEPIMPEGLPLNTATLISGPGGSGKPLIGDILISTWLRNGGSTVFMSLQYPDTSFIYKSIKAVAGLNLDDYRDKVVFISLDAGIQGMGEPEANVFKANLVKPEIWDAAIEKACAMVPDEGPGIMVFGSALNLLLFSPTYGEDILNKMETLFREDKSRTYVFAVSTSAKKKEIERLEKIADNLIMTRSEEEPFRLFMSIVRMKDIRFSAEEFEVPIPPKSLVHIKEIAEHSRRRVIPQVSKI